MKQLVERGGIDAADGLLLGDEPLGGQLHGAFLAERRAQQFRLYVGACALGSSARGRALLQEVLREQERAAQEVQARAAREATAHRDAEITILPAKSNLNACDAAMTTVSSNAQAKRCARPNCWMAAWCFWAATMLPTLQQLRTRSYI